MSPKLKIRHASNTRPASKAIMVASALTLLPLTMVLFLEGQSGARDPGVRGGPPGAGGPIPGLTDDEKRFFDSGQEAFQEVDRVAEGLGPRFNLDSCYGCHAQPAAGGSSPFENPQVEMATKDGATNTVPFFVTIDGPAREARFKSDGGVHALYTITGRTDAPGCRLKQPDFRTEADRGNTVFRIPTPTFGTGLIEAIPDQEILRNIDADRGRKEALGIRGRPNRTGHDGTITRFGWKAQNKSLKLFAGEAYNVEQGVTNELFPQERDESEGCQFNPVPEDHTNFVAVKPEEVLSDVLRFVNFMRFLDQPRTALESGPIRDSGRVLFERIGCGLCHVGALNTGRSTFRALDRQPVYLFSDLLLHRMGSGLADDIRQGEAAGDEFRTAPLWGLGQRIFFLHDGRTSDLVQAIQAHTSVGSEANAVVENFNALREEQKQDILNFLRSL